MLMSSPKKHIPAGVIGAGSFGITVAHLLAFNNEVLLYARDPEVVRKINEDHALHGVALSPRIKAVTSPEAIIEACEVIFPVIPSDDFRAMMRTFGPLL